MDYPQWVLKHKKKGTEIRKVEDRYYLYKISSVYNKTKKRAQKITEAYLGRVTLDGLIPPKHKQLLLENPSVKEYGAFSLVQELIKEIEPKLEEVFGQDSKAIAALACIRTIYKCPFKRIAHHYANSYLSEMMPNLLLSAKNISELLLKIGARRDKIVKFLQFFIQDERHIIFDATNIFSASAKMDICRLGYNRNKIYDSQINLLYAFSHTAKAPVYYRILPGNIRDVTLFALSILEAGLKDTIVVADKGFGSSANIALLDEQDLRYVIPLKRSSKLFDDAIIRSGDKCRFDGHFLYKKRPIFYYLNKTADGKIVMVFVDEILKASEQKDYMLSIEKGLEGYDMDGFYARQYRFGSLLFLINFKASAKEVFEIYKSRNEIETYFDVFKNLMGYDVSYMQNERSLEAWLFLNHISMIIIYKIYALLKKNELLSRYSPADLIEHLKYIFKIKIGNSWLTSEIDKKTMSLMKSLEIHIT